MSWFFGEQKGFLCWSIPKNLNSIDKIITKTLICVIRFDIIYQTKFVQPNTQLHVQTI